MRTLNNYEWKQDKEDEQGFYFVLTDTLHHLDYNVLLIKDNGQIMVNGDYINNVPQEIAAAISPRLDYFMALNKVRHQYHHHDAKNRKPRNLRLKNLRKRKKKSLSRKRLRKRENNLCQKPTLMPIHFNTRLHLISFKQEMVFSKKTEPFPWLIRQFALTTTQQ